MPSRFFEPGGEGPQGLNPGYWVAHLAARLKAVPLPVFMGVGGWLVADDLHAGERGSGPMRLDRWTAEGGCPHMGTIHAISVPT